MLAVPATGLQVSFTKDVRSFDFGSSEDGFILLIASMTDSLSSFAKYASAFETCGFLAQLWMLHNRAKIGV
jgi:hypothetical protein